jgi:hypothetical protein
MPLVPKGEYHDSVKRNHLCRRSSFLTIHRLSLSRIGVMKGPFSMSEHARDVRESVFFSFRKESDSWKICMRSTVQCASDIFGTLSMLHPRIKNNLF